MSSVLSRRTAWQYIPILIEDHNAAGATSEVFCHESLGALAAKPQPPSEIQVYAFFDFLKQWDPYLKTWFPFAVVMFLDAVVHASG